jgi:hypothetical protein
MGCVLGLPKVGDIHWLLLVSIGYQAITDCKIIVETFRKIFVGDSHCSEVSAAERELFVFRCRFEVAQHTI